MKLQAVQNNVQAVGMDGEAHRFRMQDSAILFKTLVRNLYPDTVLAPIREYLCNALDAHMMIHQSRPFEVMLPNTNEPTWRVRDFGPGMAEDFVYDTFTVLGASTKTNDDGQVGGFGLGCKTGFADGDQFSVISWHGGYKMTFACYFNERDEPDVRLVSKEQSSEPTGVEIILPVRPHKFDEYITKTKRILQHFPEGSFQCDSHEIKKFEPSYEESAYMFEGDPRYGLHNLKRLRVKMGPVLYDVPADFEVGDIKAADFRGVILKAKLGDFALAPSRESISLTDAGSKKIHDTLKVIRDNAEGKAIEFVANATNVWEALSRHNQAKGRPLVSNQAKFVWKGKEMKDWLSLERRTDTERLFMPQGERGGPAKEINRVNCTTVELLPVILDTEDRVPGRIRENAYALRYAAQKINPAGKNLWFTSEERLKALGVTSGVPKLSDFEPPAKAERKKRNPEDIIVYKRRDRRHHRYDASPYEQSVASWMPRKFFWVPFSGSNPETPMMQAMLSCRWASVEFFGITKSNRDILDNEDYDPMNLIEHIQERAEGLISDPEFVETYRQYQMHQALRRVPDFDRYKPHSKKLQELYVQEPLRINFDDIHSVTHLARIGAIKFDISEPDMTKVEKAVERFKKRNPLLVAVLTKSYHSFTKEEEEALAKAVKQ